MSVTGAVQRRCGGLRQHVQLYLASGNAPAHIRGWNNPSQGWRGISRIPPISRWIWPSPRWTDPSQTPGRCGRPARGTCESEKGVQTDIHTLLKGSTEACLQTSKVGDASVMLNHDMGSSCKHFGSSSVTSTFAAAAHHGDDFTAFPRLHTLITFLHLLLFAF